MNIVGAILADFTQAPAGGPAQLEAELAGAAVLVHTLRRLARVAGLTKTCVAVRPADVERARALVAVAGLAETVDVLPVDDGTRPRRLLLTTARRWGLDAWRGTLLGTTWYDEFVDPPTVGRVLAHYRADAVFCADGHQAVIDPAVASQMVRRAMESADSAPFVFAPAPPGLAGLILRVDTVAELLRLDIPFGLLLGYRPELAQPDPITRPACVHLPPEVSRAIARFVPDTRWSREVVAGALADLGPEADAGALCRWAADGQRGRAAHLPVEIELELTTDDTLPESTLRPRGARVPRRQLDDWDALARRVAELAAWDDRLVVLGGHGEPLRFPRLAEVCRLLRDGGVYGVAVVTSLLDLTEANFAALCATPVDIVQVRLDAVSSAQYQRVHGVDRLGEAVANVERIETWRRQNGAPRPIVVCSLTRTAATIDELEPFYDLWVQRLGAALIDGGSDFGGILPPDGLISTTPPVRGPCCRLGRRMMLLADGAVPLCDQDVRGETAVGDWREATLAELWRGAKLSEVRELHGSGRWGALPLCGRCGQWFRP